MEHLKKSEIRNSILYKRKNMKYDEVCLKSGIIIEKLRELVQYKNSSVIMCYVDFCNEVKTLDFIRQSIREGKRIAVPKVIAKDTDKRKIIAVEINDLEKDLKLGSYGILEPVNTEGNEIPVNEIDMAVVPGIAFDLMRNRIGFGAGYYDKFLSNNAERCFKVGIGYDYQILDEIPAGRYDIPMDLIITEARTI